MALRYPSWPSQLVKNRPTHTGDVEDAGSVPGSGRSPGEGNGNPLQYSCLGNPPDRGACQAITVHGVAKSQTRLSRCTHTSRKNRVALQPFKLYCKWRALTSDNRSSPLPTLKLVHCFPADGKWLETGTVSFLTPQYLTFIGAGKVKASVAQSCLTLCDPTDCSHQAYLSLNFSWQILEWVAIPFSKGSS